MEERDVVKELLSNLRGYLRDHLPVDVDFLSKLHGKRLLAKENADKLRTAVKTEGGKSGVDGLLDYMSYYDEELLEKFCVFLEEYSQPARPLLSKIAKKIREDLKHCRQPPIKLETVKQEYDDNIPGPSRSAPMFHAKSFMDKYKERFLRCVYTPSIATRLKVDHVIPEALYCEIDRGKITASEASEKLFLHLQSHAIPDTIHHLCDVMAGQEDYPLMKKLGEDMKKDKDLPPSSTDPLPMKSTTSHPCATSQDVPRPSGTTRKHPTNTPTLTDTSTPTTVAEPKNEDTRFYPVISQLEDDFAELASAVLAHIKSLEEGNLGNLRSFLANLLKPKHTQSSPPPRIPKSLDDLEFFLTVRWDELQIRVISGVVNHLQVESLSTQMEAYKQKLVKEIIAFLSCDKRIATYKQIPNHLLVAVTIDCNPEVISLKRILELKDYFIYKLGLGEALFQAYSTGSTILYFSIPEDSVWCLPACLHPSNLPQLEEWKVVSLSVEGKCTIDLVEKRIVDELDQFPAPPYQMETLYQSESQGMGPGPLQEMESDKLRLFEEEKLKLSHLYWREEPDVSEEMWWPTAVYLNGKIFVGERWYYQQFLCVFDVVSRTWSELPFHDSCEMSDFTLATSNSKVHTLGGTWSKDGKVEEYSNKVFSLDDDLKWCNTLPPLNIGRIRATSTSFDSFILVAGGQGRSGELSSVEVLNSSQSSSTWWEICDLPVKSSLMQCTVTHDELFIGCGRGTANTVYAAKLSAVKESLNVDEDSESSVSPECFWQSLPTTPLRGSGLVSVNNCLLTVGGIDDDLKPHSSVHFHDCYEKTWSKVSDIRMSRDSPAVVVSTFENKQELFVLGGGDADTSVESCELF